MKCLKVVLLLLGIFLTAVGSASATTSTLEISNLAWYTYGYVSGVTQPVLTYTAGQGLTDVVTFPSTTPSAGSGMELDYSLDLRKYQQLQVTYKLTSTNSYVTADGKNVEFVFWDSSLKNELLSIQSSGVSQNLNAHLVADGASHVLTLDIRQLTRPSLASLCINLDYLNYPMAYSYTLKITSIKYVGNSPLFDGKATGTLTPPSNKTSAHTLTTSDFMTLKMTSAGAIVGVTKAPSATGTAVDWSNSNMPGGFLIRDNTNATPTPTQITGTVSTITGGFSVAGTSSSLHVNTTCNYTTGPNNAIHVKLTATNTSSSSRYLTYYFALPVKWGSWIWSSSLLTQNTVNPPSTVNASGPFYEETANQWPVATISNATSNLGLALAVPLDQPRNYRIEYNEQTGIFYVAFDIGLSNITTAGGNLNTASCELYLYSCDPTWSLRSAVQSFYNDFPQWFVKHVPQGGGWRIPGGPAEPGLRFFWNSGPGSVWDSNAASGVGNIVYIDPREIDMAMCDLTPTDSASFTRFTNLAAASPSEWAALDNLTYNSYTAWGTVPYQESNLQGYWDSAATAGIASCIIQVDGNRIWNINYTSAYGTTPSGGVGFGTGLQCNMDPLIPNGLGALNLSIMAQEYSTIAGQTTPGNGWAFDLYICDYTADYNTANFAYSPFPLSFEADVQRLSIPMRLTMAAWVQNLTQQSWFSSNNQLNFANIQGNFTYSAPYIDIFGMESSVVPTPDYFRTMAGGRVVTYLPYSPRADADSYYNLLYDFYPGTGLNDYQYQAMAPVLDSLTAAGWQPVTYVTSNVPQIRLERYGSGNPFYVVCYNTDSAAHTFNLSVNTTGIGQTPTAAVEIFGPNQNAIISPSGGTYPVTLAGGAICVLQMQSGVILTTSPISGDTDILAAGAGQTVTDAYILSGSGGSSVAINGVTFTQPLIGTSPATLGNVTLTYSGAPYTTFGTTPGAPFSGLSANYKTLLSNVLYGFNGGSGGTALSVTAKNLVVGTNYTVRFWVEYLHGAWGYYDTFTSGGFTSPPAQENLTYYNATTGDNSAQYSGLGEYVTSVFTATATTQVFTINGYSAPGGGAVTPVLNAVEVVKGP